MENQNWAEIQPIGEHHTSPVLLVTFLTCLLLLNLFALYFWTNLFFFLLAVAQLALLFAIVLVRFDADHQLIRTLRSYYCQYFDYTVAYKKVNHELKKTIKELEGERS